MTCTRHKNHPDRATQDGGRCRVIDPATLSILGRAANVGLNRRERVDLSRLLAALAAGAARLGSEGNGFPKTLNPRRRQACYEAEALAFSLAMEVAPLQLARKRGGAP